MKKLLLLFFTLLLSFFSTQGLANVGDVYKCQMIQRYEITRGMPLYRLELKDFKFFRNNDSVKFMGFPLMNNMDYKLVTGNSYGQRLDEVFQGYNDWTDRNAEGVINFVYTLTRYGGEFSFTRQFANTIEVVLADCRI